MKKSAFVIASVFFSLFVSNLHAATYGGGSGTAEDPYQIWTAEQMNTIGVNSGDWTKCFKLMADIDMGVYAGTQYNLIGITYENHFSGTFDGNGHVISNLTYSTTSLTYFVGLFGYVVDATITNLGLENVNLNLNGWYVGGLVGYQRSGTITNCYSRGTVTSSCSYMETFVGGLAGSQGGTMTHCYSTGTVSATTVDNDCYVGGIAGHQCGIMADCYSTKVVTSIVSSPTSSSYSFAGGLVGLQESYGTITSCYSMGTSTSVCVSHSFAGGLAGCQAYGTIANCYSTGTATVDPAASWSYVGGLVGRMNSTASATNSFWDMQTSGLSVGVGSGSTTGVTGKTTDEMMTFSTFTDAGWDFAETWGIGNGQTYPYLKPFNGINSADIDSSGAVDMTDLSILAENWLQGI